MTTRHDAALADAVRRGLTATQKELPPFLFYDAKGSDLFEAITRLPEYYLTRTERSILEVHADAIARTLVEHDAAPISVLELGAGSAEKTELVLRSLVAQVGGARPVTYIPADVSPTPLAAAQARLARSLPTLRVSPMVGAHDEVLARVAASEGPLAILFLGSSIGNYEDRDAIALLARAGQALGRRGPLLLGVDDSKPLDVLLPAYDDAAGVTAEFNRNVLARINGELDANFRLEAFAHVALWNEEASAIELFLESKVPQSVRIEALDLTVSFAHGERIHTESSHKYTARRIEALFRSSGLREEAVFEDDRAWFSLRVARPAR